MRISCHHKLFQTGAYPNSVPGSLIAGTGIAAHLHS